MECNQVIIKSLHIAQNFIFRNLCYQFLICYQYSEKNVYNNNKKTILKNICIFLHNTEKTFMC